jgi:hypothetical protein
MTTKAKTKTKADPHKGKVKQWVKAHKQIGRNKMISGYYRWVKKLEVAKSKKKNKKK